MASILSRYLAREVLVHALGVMAIVVGIFLVRRFSGLLADAAEGALPPAVILHLLSLRTIMALPSLLPVVLYLGVLLGLGRLYEDHEMIALAACGIPPRRIARIVLGFSLVVAMVVGALSLLVRPWAGGRFHHVRDQALRVLNVGGLSPGRFYEIGVGGEQVMFAEQRGPHGAMENVFVQSREDDEVSIFFSDRAVEQLDESTGYRFFTLIDGYRYDLRPDQGKYYITQYREFVVRTRLQPTTLDEALQRADSTTELFRSNTLPDIAELQWRLAMPVSAFLLALLALPLSRVEPRHGKYAKLFVAILLYLVYRQLLGTAKDWVTHGTLPPVPGMWAVHALCLAAAAVLLARGTGWWYRLANRLTTRVGAIPHSPPEHSS